MSVTDPLSRIGRTAQDVSPRAPSNGESARTITRFFAQLLVRTSVQLENSLYEYKLGIRTSGLYNWRPGNWDDSEHIYYGSTLYRRIFRVLDALHLGPSDTFVDLGCGKGRVTCCASLYSIQKVIGVEDIAELCELAKANLESLRGRHTPAAILHAKAEEFDFTSGTVIYMFHPFGPRTLASVLTQLARGLMLNPRQVRIIYVNPVHESVLAETEWLEMYARWPAQRRLSTDIMHAVSFWKLRPSANALPEPSVL